MSFLRDRLLLRLVAEQSNSREFNIHILKNKNSIDYLLPFSCISLINSQLTILSQYNRKFLCKSVINFIESPKVLNYNARIVSKFILELFIKSRGTVYNQFQPIFYGEPSPEINDALEMSIIIMVMNYISKIYYKSGLIDQNKIRIFLLISISFFQQDLLPIINRIDMTNIKSREKLAIDHVNFSSSIYDKWNSKLPLHPGNDLFNQHLQSVVEFDVY